MKNLLLLATLFWLIACNDEESATDFTGREITYDLVQSSDFPVSGTATFKERIDGSVELQISLSGTDGNIQHPAHLHFGDVSSPEAEIAYLLNAVPGTSGESISQISLLSDESAFSFDRAMNFEGHIKIHLDGGANQNTILASGNIGSAYTKKATGSRRDIAVCKSE